jgi:hypothetical protein
MKTIYRSPSFAKHLTIKEPDILYHYTDQTGLLGIVQNGELWATKIQYMNDATELRLIFKFVDEKLDAEERISADSSVRKIVCEHLRRFTQALKDVNVCAICFCENGDLLSQWRGYSKGGFGYSLGFKSQRLKNFMKEDFILSQCIYDRTTQSRIIEEICDHFLQCPIADLSRTFEQFMFTILECGAFFKDRSFSEENEWRLVSPPLNPSQLHFRPGKSMITPYCKLSIVNDYAADTPIDHTIVGPCPHIELSASAVKVLLFKETVGFPPPGVVPLVRGSEIPYRDW